MYRVKFKKWKAFEVICNSLGDSTVVKVPWRNDVVMSYN